MAFSEAKADILKGSWQDWGCNCADDEKHVPWENGSAELNILKEQTTSMSSKELCSKIITSALDSDVGLKQNRQCLCG